MKDIVTAAAKNARAAVKRNTLVALIVASACLGMIAFAWLGSVITREPWKSPDLSTSTPTSTITPGWWAQILTPTLPPSFQTPAPASTSAAHAKP